MKIGNISDSAPDAVASLPKGWRRGACTTADLTGVSLSSFTKKMGNLATCAKENWMSTIVSWCPHFHNDWRFTGTYQWLPHLCAGLGHTIFFLVWSSWAKEPCFTWFHVQKPLQLHLPKIVDFGLFDKILIIFKDKNTLWYQKSFLQFNILKPVDIFYKIQCMWKKMLFHFKSSKCQSRLL